MKTATISRFDRTQKTLQEILEVQKLQGHNLAGMVTILQGQVERMDRIDARTDRMDARIDHLATKVDDLVGAIRNLIDRIPPENLTR
jgi:hypothetical protein